ncbi:MAG TPA: septum formation initiator family protein [Candidatus Moranbacteria bacterium]|nr:septum formation initiator family protein [Candidatus Moranbacteria bacterium]HSA08110.1 septum formation initiator family protein [Candidatus Moranbacteria bacterium]
MKKKISFTIVFFIAGIILTGIISTRAVQEAYRNRRIEKEVNELKNEALQIQNENAKIQKKIEYYSTPEFVEKISKDKMNMQKPDEKVIVVNQEISREPQIAGAQQNQIQNEQYVPNYLKWWNFFFKYD